MQICICRIRVEYRTIEEWCEILDSQRIPITAKNRIEGPYPYYGANGIQDYVNDYIFDNELVLLAEDGGNFGSKDRPIAYRVSGKCWVNNHAHVLKPKKGLDVDYLCYSLMFYNTNGLVNGATRQKLTQSTMRTMKIPCLEINEQQEIVQKIKKIESILNDLNGQLELLDELIKARFVEMFGDPVLNEKSWKVIKLGELCSKICSGNTPKGGSDNYKKEGIMFFRSQNVWKNRLELDDIVYIDEATHERMKETSLNYGDILITKTGRINTENSSLGRSALFLGKNGSANINGHVYLVRINSELVNRNFVLQILISPQYRDLIRRVCVGGIDKRQLNQNHIYDFPIIIPPLELQNQFASFVQEIDKSRLLNNHSLFLIKFITF